MKETLLRNAQYNVWANAQFITIIQSLSAELMDKEIISSFSSIRKTVLHVWGAEDIWLQRLGKVEKPVWKALSFEGTTQDLCSLWTETSQALLDYVAALPGESSLTEIIPVISLKGDYFEDVVLDVLQHVFNHATYHRGQLVTMLRQAGITTIPQTDMIAYTRQISTAALT